VQSGGGSRGQEEDARQDVEGRILRFLRTCWSTFASSAPIPIGNSLTQLLEPPRLAATLTLTVDLIRLFLVRRKWRQREKGMEMGEADRAGEVDIRELEDLLERDGLMEREPHLVLQTAIIALEKALGVELRHVNATRIAQGDRDAFLHLCQNLETVFDVVSSMDDEEDAKEKQPVDAHGESSLRHSTAEKPSSMSQASVAGGTCGVGVGVGASLAGTEYSTFTRSGINRENPFQSRKHRIFPKQSATATDQYEQREEERRRSDREDEEYAGSKSGGVKAGGGDEDEDETYRRRSEDDAMFRDNDRSAHRRARYDQSHPSAASYTARHGHDGIDDGDDDDDNKLNATMDYLESFIHRAKENIAFRRRSGMLDSAGEEDWERQRSRTMGGRRPRRAWEEEDIGLGSSTYRSNSHSPDRAYQSPTVSSQPFRHSPLRSPRASSSRYSSVLSRRTPFGARHDKSRARLEEEIELMRRRRDAASARTNPTKSDAGDDGIDEREIDVALQKLRDAEDLERSIHYLSQHTTRRADDDVARVTNESLKKVLSEKFVSPMRRSRSSAHLSTSPMSTHTHTRIPPSHPHRTGRNHIRSSCVYCQREADELSWSLTPYDALDRDTSRRDKESWRDTPSSSSAAAAAKKGREAKVVEPAKYEAQSRLRPLATKLLEQSKQLSSRGSLGRDVSQHFLAQLSAAARRRSSRGVAAMWQSMSNAEREKDAQLRRAQKEIDEEALKSQLRLKWVEEQAIERALSRTVFDRQQEREIERLLKDQARQVAKLLHLKRESLSNYAKDQSDLVSEHYRVERETQRLRASHDRHAMAALKREMREAREEELRRRINHIRHMEEKHAWKIQQLKRAALSKDGIEGLREYQIGRSNR